MGKSKTLVKNTILFAIGSFGNRILSFFLVPLYTSCLSTVEYGVADLLTTSYTVCMFIFSLSIFDAVFPFVNEYRKKQKGILRFAEITIIWGGFLFACILIAMWILGYEIKRSYFVYLILGYFLNALGRCFQNYLQCTDRVKIVVTAGFIQTLSMLVCNILLLTVCNLGLHGYMISLLFSSFLSCAIEGVVILNEDAADTASVNRELLKKILKFTFPLIFNNVFWWVNASIDKYFISLMCGAGQNGIYSVASKIPSILTMFVSFFLQAWGISAIKEFDPDDNSGFYSNTYNSFHSFITVLCSLMVIMIVPIAKIMFANEFYIAWKYAVFLLLSTLFSSLSSFIGSIFAAVKESKMFAASTIFAAAVNILLNWLMIPKFGVLGAAIATVVSFGSVWGIRMYYSFRFIKWKIPLYKDVVCFILLSVQISLSWTEGHAYLVQALIFAIMVFIQKRYLCSVFFHIAKIIRRK